MKIYTNGIYKGKSVREGRRCNHIYDGCRLDSLEVAVIMESRDDVESLMEFLRIAKHSLSNGSESQTLNHERLKKRLDEELRVLNKSVLREKQVKENPIITTEDIYSKKEIEDLFEKTKGIRCLDEDIENMAIESMKENAKKNTDSAE